MILGGRENWLRAKGSKNESKVSFVSDETNVTAVPPIVTVAAALGLTE